MSGTSYCPHLILEILVTHSRWDVYVPADVRYGEPRGGMALVRAVTPVSSSDLAGAKTIDRLFVRWPNRDLGITVLENLAVDQSIEIFEGSDRHEVLRTRPVSDAGRVAALRGSP